MDSPIYSTFRIFRAMGKVGAIGNCGEFGYPLWATAVNLVMLWVNA